MTNDEGEAPPSGTEEARRSDAGPAQELPPDHDRRQSDIRPDLDARQRDIRAVRKAAGPSTATGDTAEDAPPPDDVPPTDPEEPPAPDEIGR
jgi:hypothetical protein